MSILLSIVALGVMIWIHELGHYCAARYYKVAVLRFSIGFGPKLFSWHNKRGTQFRLSAIPLGGYVQMLELDFLRPGEEHFRPLCFQSQSIGARAVIIAAGPLANLLLALLLNAAILMNGVTHVVPKIGGIIPDSPAASAEMRVGEIITKVDGEAISNWRDMAYRLAPRLGHTGTIDLETRDDNGQINTYQLPIESWLSSAEFEGDLLDNLGISSYQPAIEPVIARVFADGAGARAGLQAGDRILSVNGEAISSWEDWVQSVRANPRSLLLLVLERNGSTLSLSVIPDAQRGADGIEVGLVGVSAQVPSYPEELLIHESHNPITALIGSVPYTYQLTLTIITGVVKLVNGQLSLDHLGGPITIVQVIDDSARNGLFELLALCAYLSLSLAILNLMPIPVLDGGHLVLLAAEALRGRPLNKDWVRRISYVGMAFLLSLMLFATYNDLLRL